RLLRLDLSDPRRRRRVPSRLMIHSRPDSDAPNEHETQPDKWQRDKEAFSAGRFLILLPSRRDRSELLRLRLLGLLLLFLRDLKRRPSDFIFGEKLLDVRVYVLEDDREVIISSGVIRIGQLGDMISYRLSESFIWVRKIITEAATDHLSIL